MGYTYKSKIVTRIELKNIINKKRMDGKKIVFTNGCFDIIHRGHVYYMRESKKLGDILIVAINSDSSVKLLKGEGKPLHKEMNRAFVLEAFDFVDYIVIFDDINPLNLLNEIKPDVYTKGSDYNMNNLIGEEIGCEIIQSWGGEAILIDLQDKN